MNSSKPPACKVVTQYQNSGERVYELETANSKLEIRVSSRSVDGERSWHVAAQSGDLPGIADEAPTKQGALEKIAAQWAEQAGDLGLPTLSWDAVAEALRTVRGI